MTLDAFKLLFAERPEAPEGVEFWEWIRITSATQATPEERGKGAYSNVGLWSPQGLGTPEGPLHYVHVVVFAETRRVYWFPDYDGMVSLWTLEGLKAFFAEHPDAPEGVEFWEWLPLSAIGGRPPVPFFAKIPLAPLGRSFPGGPPDYVHLWWGYGQRTIYYWSERPGAIK